MKGKTHAGMGILTFLSVYEIIPGGFSYFGMIIVVFSSVLPDIDHPKSIINKYILPFKNKMTKVVLYGCIGIILLWYDYLYLHEPLIRALGIVFIIIAISSHRSGLTHSLMGMAMFSFIAGYLGNMYDIKYLVYYFMIGYGMHLICDMFTNRGVPLFYPFRKKKVKFPLTYRTNSKIGSAIEQLLMIGGLLFTIYKIPAIFYR
ncbi:MAG: metal-dependent hydrolase [Clostridium sp.]|jgi:inner membrane protein|uniref:metal-dependent hydrolase n=1 Tax=Clostridium sp. TaxID=1506 RepID=UPI0025C4E9FB|nr:metal-dependent hydrolase [Clostridium sp.]MCH3965882.1 metal-dependent hydrolase [Clostridium sp.]MCI1716029.1 metal-dependent hydrolase [Clostridium sp.]MCI1800299.1 metal-dependent hydrolase [Clostridium sp.]MCI1814206.1 metal-dependent hydrolase [Clostridium sp.]MCI1871105.1 metal-dependent hydrolase [Clostridium sp.]